MQSQVAAMLRRVRWDERESASFLGSFLTEPKSAVVFEAPDRRLDAARFRRAAQRRGLRLDRRTQLLYDSRQLFINGEAMAWPVRGAALLKQLANRRLLDCEELDASAPSGLLYRWYCDGYLRLA
jgi:50S ribosomal protein L16 3-hydroxylase